VVKEFKKNWDEHAKYYQQLLCDHPLLDFNETRRLMAQAQIDLAEEVARIRKQDEQEEQEAASEEEAAASEDKKNCPASPAMDKLLLHNQRFLFNEARKFFAKLPWETKENVDVFDLMQIANFGLRRAILGFDLSRNLQLSTYATPWVRQAMRRALHNDYFSVRRAPVHIHTLHSMWSGLIERIWASHLNWDEPLNFFDGICLREVARTVGKHDRFVSLDATPAGYDEESDITLGEVISDARIIPADQLIAKGEVLGILDKSIVAAKLSENELVVVCYRFGIRGLERKTLTQVGEGTGLTRQRISQVEIKALVKLEQAGKEAGIDLCLEADIRGSRTAEEKRAKKEHPKFSKQRLAKRLMGLKYIPTNGELILVLKMTPDEAEPLLKEYKKKWKIRARLLGRKAKKLNFKRRKVLQRKAVVAEVKKPIEPKVETVAAAKQVATGPKPKRKAPAVTKKNAKIKRRPGRKGLSQKEIDKIITFYYFLGQGPVAVAAMVLGHSKRTIVKYWKKAGFKIP